MSFLISHEPKMKNSQRIGVRQYNKSELPRLRWTTELHELFVEAVEHLGGKDSKFLFIICGGLAGFIGGLEIKVKKETIARKW